MTDEEFARRYWAYADAEEEKLLKELRRLGLYGRVAEVYDHFRGKVLGERIPMREVVSFHNQIDTWLETGGKVREYKIILRDARARKTIQRREELFVWLLASLFGWYDAAMQAAGPVLLHTAQERHRDAVEQARTATGVVTRTKTPQSIRAVMGEINPTFGRTVQQKLFLEAQYQANQMLHQFSAAELDGKTPEPDPARLARMERSMLSRSESGGHHGIIDQQLAFVVGHTVLQAFEDAGVKKFKFIAVMDNKTTHACRALNGKVFAIQDAKLGVNVPPISVDQDGLPIPHPCRSMIRVEE